MEVKNRSELVFLYDTTNANPNGDPDENKPRIDEETERNIVTDVRLKRTIRDYLYNYKGKDVWLIEELKEGTAERKTREEKLEEFWKKHNIEGKEVGGKKLLEEYIDLRLFGATIAGKKEQKKGEKVFTWTGPVQFKFGRSLHKVEPQLIKGTSVLPTEENKAGGAFTESWILPYSLIGFYGIINENAAKTTGLSEEDIKELLDGMWNGTKNLITRSKTGQVPRLLIRVEYSENNYHIGDLENKIKLLDKEGREVDNGGMDGKSLRGIQHVKLDISELVKTLKQNKEKVKEIQIEINDEVTFILDGSEFKGKELFKKLREVSEVSDRLKELGLDR